MSVPQAANDRWSPDFTSEAVTNGRRFRALAVVNDFMRDCLAQVADTSLSGARACGNRRLSSPEGGARCHRHRRWHRVHLDGHSDIVSADRYRLALHHARKAPQRRRRLSRANGIPLLHIESICDRLRDEFLNNLHFSMLSDACPQNATRKQDDNRHRPHSALENIPRAEFAINIRLEKTAA